MRRYLTNFLALIGGMTLIASMAAFVLGRFTESPATGVVLGLDRLPASGTPIFLDRGHGAIERYVTDSSGRFSLPVEGEELARSKWLICVPGGIPAVIYPHLEKNRIGHVTYGSTALPKGKPAFIRSFGWLGPVPRECPRPLDSIVWRYPASAGRDPREATLQEPDWKLFDQSHLPASSNTR